MNSDQCRVLLVEDDPIAASAMHFLFTDSQLGNFNAIHAGTLADAMKCLATEKPDVVALDLNLPDSSGLDTVRSVLSLSSDVPIVILSGMDDEDTAIESLKLGAQDYLVKGQEDGRTIVRTLQYAVERKRTELEMRNLQAMVHQERRMEAIGILASGIMHEISTPTQLVSTNLEFIATAYDAIREAIGTGEKLASSEAQSSDEAQKEAVARLVNVLKTDRFKYFRDEMKNAISESAYGMERLKDLIRSMKAFVRGGEQQLISADVNRVVTDAVNLSRSEWKYSAAMHLELDSGLPPLDCCPPELCQAFLNLIVNAVHAIVEKYNPKGDPSTPAHGDITIKTIRRGDDIEISITDNGAGIADAVKDRIFEPFFTTKKIGEGSGQGLSIAYNIIVNKHGGRIGFTSKVNQGTVFTVSLPIRVGQNKAAGVCAA